DLLATDAIAEPLIVGGVRCHGGFDDGGDYHSPRTRNRNPAIEAWQRNHTAAFGTELIDVPLSTWPETYPNVDQAKFLVGEEVRVFADLDLDFEMLIQRMINILLIEISAFHTFAWAETVLSDTDLVAGDGAAARLVSYIRQDETPHVEYLKTALTEMRDRTFVGESGRKYAGAEIVGRLWERGLAESLGPRREQNLALTLREVEHALDGSARRDSLLEEFHEHGSIRPTDDGAFVAASTY